MQHRQIAVATTATHSMRHAHAHQLAASQGVLLCTSILPPPLTLDALPLVAQAWGASKRGGAPVKPSCRHTTAAATPLKACKSARS